MKGKEYINTTGCLIGLDNDRNYYFSNGLLTYVYRFSGNLTEVILAKTKYPETFPKIDPDGNIYYCHLNEENGTVDLYKIDRVW